MPRSLGAMLMGVLLLALGCAAATGPADGSGSNPCFIAPTGQCVSNDSNVSCCPMDGWRSDFARRCREAQDAVFFCYPHVGHDGVCITLSTAGCYQRPEADGGVAAFSTPNTWPQDFLGVDAPTPCTTETRAAIRTFGPCGP